MLPRKKSGWSKLDRENPIVDLSREAAGSRPNKCSASCHCEHFSHALIAALYEMTLGFTFAGDMRQGCDRNSGTSAGA